MISLLATRKNTKQQRFQALSNLSLTKCSFSSSVSQKVVIYWKRKYNYSLGQSRMAALFIHSSEDLIMTLVP